MAELRSILADKATLLACELSRCAPGPTAVALVRTLHHVKAALLEIETAELLTQYQGG